MSAGNHLLAVWMGVPEEHEAELNRWYDEEHIADRMVNPGFLALRRYVSIKGEPKYVALYDLEDARTLYSEPYQKARANPTPWAQKVMASLSANIRNEYEPLTSLGEAPADGAPYALLVRVDVDPAHEAGFNAWYDEEHLPALAAVPGVLAARRYRLTAGPGPKYLAVYELATEAVPESDAWRKAGDTPRTAKLRPYVQNVSTNLGRLIKSVRA